MSQNLQNFAKFQKFQLDNLVDFEKCCKTRIFLQRSVPIQPKTSDILPNFCQKFANSSFPRRRWTGTALSPMSSRSARSWAPWTRSRYPPQEGKCLSRAYGRLYRARSRLYRSQILQVNMRLNYFESSRRDLHNALLCTALKSHFFLQKKYC